MCRNVSLPYFVALLSNTKRSELSSVQFAGYFCGNVQVVHMQTILLAICCINLGYVVNIVKIYHYVTGIRADSCYKHRKSTQGITKLYKQMRYVVSSNYIYQDESGGYKNLY